MSADDFRLNSSLSYLIQKSFFFVLYRHKDISDDLLEKQYLSGFSIKEKDSCAYDIGEQ